MNLQILLISGLVCTFIFLSSFTNFVFAEDFPVIFAFKEQYLPSKYTQSYLTFMINNALGGSSSYVSNSGESHETFKEQYLPSKYTQSYLTFMINNALGGSSSYVSNSGESHETFKEQYLPSKYTQSYLTFMINNALGGSSSYVSNSGESHETFKEQFISIESLDYNNKMIFEDPSQELTSLSTNSAPFILPVPFP